MVDKPIGIQVCAALFAIEGMFCILVGTGVFLTDIKLFGLFFLMLGVALLAVAYGIWKMKKWGKDFGSALAVMTLINIPVGTIIGIVILYFLLIDKNTKDLFTE